jgi:pyruvate,orthophosphate dikinase
MAKDRMIEALGVHQLLLPGLVADALVANDRVKYLLTLLQTARVAADGGGSRTALREERLACGIEDEALDRVVPASAREPDGRYRIPRSEALAQGAVEQVRRMLAPLHAAEVTTASALDERVDALSGELRVEGDVIDASDVVRLTAGPSGGADSLHQVVMDAHRELAALQARLATESIDGARAHNLEPGDRALVRAFMAGVHATERLRFDHPGLGTLATRAGRSLVIQNDLGTTDAHIVVVRVSGFTVTITYTDVHLARLLFFQELLSPWPVGWEDTRSRADGTVESGIYHLAAGRLTADDDAELERFLEHLGSRLVFMIDWNRARKRLRRLVGRRSAVELLRWAADERHGHIAFLLAGADGLVYDALEFAGGRVARGGETLEDVLGADAAEEYLRAALRICAQGLASGRALSLVQDEVRAELTSYLRTARQEFLELALRHAELVVEIAESARSGLEGVIAGVEARRRVAAARAQAAEHHADLIVQEARTAATRAPDLEPFLELIEAADDIADCAEEAAFYVTLLPGGQPGGGVRAPARRIAGLVLASARQYLRALQLAAELRRGGPREDMDAFLEATHGAIALERDTDGAQRAIHQALATDEPASSGVAVFVIVELTRAFEEAADALMHAAHLLRTHTLGRVVRSEAVARVVRETAPAPAISKAPSTDHVWLVGDELRPIPDALVIGAKAQALARMALAGLRVPEAAVLTTEIARNRLQPGSRPVDLREVVADAVEMLSARTGLRLGSARRPLLLSVRSGAPVSMPGMLETVLNVGLGETAVGGLVALTGNPRLAWDSYRRFVESYATVVRGCPHDEFERALVRHVRDAGVTSACDLGAHELRQITRDHLRCYSELTGEAFPQDPLEQLVASVAAVFASWDAPKAREYRRLHGIADDLGTAVILQRMVFGNAGGLSGAGVGFTRDPALGRRGLYMDFLLDAQGEDIVAGRRTVEGTEELGALAPDVLAEIDAVCPRLEAEFGDAQEFELTVQDGELFLLQARTAKRTPWAALQIAVDQVEEGLIPPHTALDRLADVDLDTIRRVHVRPGAAGAVLARAIPASMGVASGPLALDGKTAARLAADGTAPVLVRAAALTEDVTAVAVAAGVLTAAGSRTSHAAVVARELGKPCLVGCGELELDLVARTARIGGIVLNEGEELALDGESGIVFRGRPVSVEERPTAALDKIAEWRAELAGAGRRD